MDSTPTPRWETAVMAGSFILIWAWYLAKQAALKGGSLGFGWNVGLIVAVIVLVVVMVTRLRRIKASLKEVSPTQLKKR